LKGQGTSLQLVGRALMSVDPDIVKWFRGAEGDEDSTDWDQNNNVLFIVVLIPSVLLISFRKVE
jgi:hypothetical protein